jgi:type I restriction enzyme S subunit
MKDSGVEWMGEIPAHWEVKRLKFLFKNLDYKRVPLSGEERSYMEKNYPYYGASGVIDTVENYLFDEPLLLVAEDGANLLSRSTPLAFIAEDKYWVNNHAHILKPKDGFLKYWEGLLQTFDYTPLISGAAQPKLTAEILGEIALPSPSTMELGEIIAFLEKETSKLDALTNKIREAIDRLKKYRTALISAAVTGKIDVRDM